MRILEHPGRIVLLSLLAAIWGTMSVVAQTPSFEVPDAYAPVEEELDAIQMRSDELARLLEQIREQPPLDPGHPDDEFADVAIFLKAAQWIVRHGEFTTPEYVGMTLDALEAGIERARRLVDGERPWRSEPGSHVFGYVSAVDGSVQPYAVIVPEVSGDRSHRLRLDVVLHGRNAQLNEVRFIADFEGRPIVEDTGGLVLHVFGRTNNAYRWAGETDVFEAIAAVKRAYPVDDRRIVLRGFSMGGAGAWHLGLHHPAAWCAVEAGAGFSDTKGYVRGSQFSEVQERALHIYDAVDYARNATMVPIAGYGGEVDPQLQASVNVREALESLGFPMSTEGLVARSESAGLDFLHVIGAEMGHKVDPASEEILKAFRDTRAEAGRPVEPQPGRFITYTLRYNQAPWFSIERLKAHYEPATVDFTPDAEADAVRVEANANVAVLGIDRRAGETVQLGEQRFSLRPAGEGLLPKVYFRQTEQGWSMLGHEESRALQENDGGAKAPGLQGPIDDAFTGPFLCVRGTGEAWNASTHAWADARLAEFAANWDKFFRGQLRIKDDADVTPEDIAGHHLILFGDPGSNALIASILDRLPIGWTRDEIRVGERAFLADGHAPALIAPNPDAPHRYVVLNSGHTFGSAEFQGTNALLYPHVGDYAVFPIGSATGEPALSGYFDESWGLRELP